MPSPAAHPPERRGSSCTPTPTTHSLQPAPDGRCAGGGLITSHDLLCTLGIKASGRGEAREERGEAYLTIGLLLDRWDLKKPRRERRAVAPAWTSSAALARPSGLGSPPSGALQAADRREPRA